MFEKFGEYYDLIYGRSHDYEGECDFFEKVFQEFCEEKPKRILDLGCGTGSHALILARRGYEVAGVDISNVMVELAREKAQEANLKVDFTAQDMRTFRLSQGFDCAICMFGGFGYLLAYADLMKLFSNLTRHLNEDGVFLFEFWSVGGLKPTPYRTWLKRQNKNLTLYRMSESNFNSETNILDIDMHYVVIDDKKAVDIFDEKHEIRCYTIAEIQHCLDKNGYALLSMYSWDTENKMDFIKPEEGTFRVMTVARAQSAQ